jgi:hypothetical protein
MRTIPYLLFAFLVVPAYADETYTIKVKVDSDVGKTIVYRSANKDTGSMKVFDADGKLLLNREKEGEETVYRSTMLERDKNGKAKKYVRVYEKDSETENGKTKTLSQQGRTVVFEKVGDKFRIGVVGEPPLAAEDIAKLYKSANEKHDSDPLLRNLSPGKPVKAGDSWDMSVKAFAESLDNFVTDIEKSSIKAKLLKTYPKGKSTFGSFDITAKFIMTALSEEGTKIVFDPPALFEMHTVLDIAIDGSSTERTEQGEMSIKGEGSLTVEGAKRKVVFDIKGTGKDEVSAESDDAKARTIGKVVFSPMPGEWAEFASKDLGFQAKFPGTVTKKADTNDRGVTTTEHGVQADMGRIYYSITVSEYPADKFKLDAATAYGNLKKGPNIKESSDIKIGGFPAVELKQDIKKDVTMHLTQRVVIVGQRMYQLMTVVTDGRPVEAKQFFDSFKLDEKAIPKKDD